MLVQSCFLFPPCKHSFFSLLCLLVSNKNSSGHIWVHLFFLRWKISGPELGIFIYHNWTIWTEFSGHKCNSLNNIGEESLISVLPVSIYSNFIDPFFFNTVKIKILTVKQLHVIDLDRFFFNSLNLWTHWGNCFFLGVFLNHLVETFLYLRNSVIIASLKAILILKLYTCYIHISEGIQKNLLPCLVITLYTLSIKWLLIFWP